MRFIPVGPEQRARMRELVGVDDVGEFFDVIPTEMRLAGAVTSAPHTAPVTRVDEAWSARGPDLRRGS